MRHAHRIALACGLMFGFFMLVADARSESFRAPIGIVASHAANSAPVADDPSLAENATAPLPHQDEFADRSRITLTRRVSEAIYDSASIVILEIPDAGDGFEEISVEQSTELGRAILRYCPAGTMCRLTVVMEGGTLARIYSVQPARP